MTEVKKTRTPRSFDAILAGAKQLSLKEQCDLRCALNSNIEKIIELKKAEAAAKNQEAEDAEKIASNTKYKEG